MAQLVDPIGLKDHNVDGLIEIDDNTGAIDFIWKDTVSGGTPERFRIVKDGGIRLQSLTSDPVTPSAGQLWFNNTSHVFKYYDTATTTLTSGGTAAATLLRPMLLMGA